MFKAGVRVCSAYGLGWTIDYYRGKSMFSGDTYGLCGRWDTTGVRVCSAYGLDWKMGYYKGKSVQRTALGGRSDTTGVRVCSAYGFGWKMGYYRGKSVFSVRPWVEVGILQG